MKSPLPRPLILFLIPVIVFSDQTSLRSTNLTSLDSRAIEVEVLGVEQDSVKVRKNRLKAVYSLIHLKD